MWLLSMDGRAKRRQKGPMGIISVVAIALMRSHLEEICLPAQHMNARV
jgi:hypothetical protein